MNYNVLRYFSVLAEMESYTKAAARLGISQPSLSSAIHNLEGDLGGVILFERVGRNIHLTQEGRFYQKKVDSALAELHEASIMLREKRENAPVVIRLGFVSGALNGFVADKIQEYCRQHSRVRFLLTEHSAEALMDLVRQEKLDMAIVDYAERDRSLHFRKLTERNLCVALSEKHPLADREILEPRDVIAEPQIVINYNVENSFGQWASGKPTDENIICTVNTVQSALDMVSTGIGITFIPDECIQNRKGVRYIPLKNWRQALYMCILYDKWLQPLVWDFREMIIRGLRND